jgi:hypothetical protein
MSGGAQIVGHKEGEDREAPALGAIGMAGPEGGVREDGARMGGRLLEACALRQLRRGGDHAAHVRRPLHHGPPLELPEHHRANPAADFQQQRVEDCLGHIGWWLRSVFPGGDPNEGSPHCIAVTGWEFRQTIVQIICAGVGLWAWGGTSIQIPSPAKGG